MNAIQVVATGTEVLVGQYGSILKQGSTSVIVMYTEVPDPIALGARFTEGDAGDIERITEGDAGYTIRVVEGDALP